MVLKKKQYENLYSTNFNINFALSSKINCSI